MQVVPFPDAVRVTLAGEIDGELVDDLAAALAVIGALGLPVMVDARAVTFVDSAGGTFLSRLYLRGPVTVVASRSVQFLLRVLGLDDMLSPEHDEP